MKKVLYSDIATGIRQPYTKVTHEWYNSMIIEASNALAKGIVGNNDTDYIVLFGCENSDSPNADISAGAIYHDGIIYLVPAYVNASITNTIVGVLSTTYSASDPVLFSDGNARYVHEIKTIEFTDATSGSGLFDYADLQLHSGICRKIYPIGSWDMNVSASGSATKDVLIDDVAGTLMPKIKSISVTILDDSLLNALPLDHWSASFAVQGVIVGYTVSGSGWSVSMKIRSGGNFDSNDYDDTTINRGFVTVEYSA